MLFLLALLVDVVQGPETGIQVISELLEASAPFEHEKTNRIPLFHVFDGVDARAIEGLGGVIDCFERARFAGSVFAGGVTAPGEIAGHPALAAAREMGRKA